MAKLYPRGDVYYSNVRIPGHPKADKRGRVRIPLDTDEELANIALARLLEQKDAYKFKRAPKGSTYKELKERVLRHAAGMAKNTLEQYTRAFKELEDYIAIHSAGQITPDLLMELYTHWKTRKKPRGLYVRNRDLQSLKASMRLAESWGMIPKGHDWGAVKRDKEPMGRFLWYPMAEIKAKIFRACKGQWLTIAKLGARAGLRRAEIYWLSWDDIDFDRKRLHVNPKPEWTPKDHEMRWIPMPDDLIAHLRSLPKESKWVLGDDRPDVGTITTIFRQIMRGTVKRGSLHTLRHSYISDLMSNGAPPKWVQEVAGHSKLDMTMRYAHLAPSSQQKITSFLSPA